MTPVASSSGDSARRRFQNTDLPPRLPSSCAAGCRRSEARKQTDTPEQTRLILRCQAGDLAAWNALVRRYENLIYNFARSLSGNDSDAGDITALVFLRLFSSLHLYQNGRSFNAWLLRIVHNIYLDACVRDSHRNCLSLDAPLPQGEPLGRLLSGTAPSPEALCLQKETSRHLAEGIRRLPSHQREALGLFVKGRSYEEIARSTGVSLGTVKSRINRARRTLLTRLEAD
ncbi:MAG TPA: sigma-70 family RNA polymerase sigma factor [Chthonomonadaceae bacterium]|nr:sigma-70 family RNA polymerase sigma factor [Chthonomonadaceae bacterium]